MMLSQHKLFALLFSFFFFSPSQVGMVNILEREFEQLVHTNSLQSEFSCLLNCTIPATDWGATQSLCTRQGTYPNNYCVGGSSFANCVSYVSLFGGIDWTILNAGTCDCPSDCSGHGVCTDSGCRCDAGYTGVDCASINCSQQTCLNRGVCKTIFPDVEISSCECDNWQNVLGDCSGTMPDSLPGIPSLLPYPQYTDWDLYGNDHPIFNESTIAQIYLSIAPEDLDFLINPANKDVKEYKHADFRFYNGATTEVLEDVGMRIKGSLSRGFAKKSWKISFNTFVKGREWAQQKKISLKDAAMDSLYIREKVTQAAIYSMGGPTPRMSHAVVYINEMLWGLYVMLEEPARDEFLKSRFGNSKGSLWKCSGPLKYLGSDPDLYRTLEYKASNDHAEESYKPLENFISVLNLTPDDEFEEQIQTVMDVEFFLRTLSAEVATGNLDGIFNANNYCLYYNIDGLFYYYRYDLDLAYGATEDSFHMASRSIWEWGSESPPGRGRLLIDRILAVPAFQEIYASYLLKLLAYVNADQFGPYAKRVNGIHSSIKEAVAVDAWHSLDVFMPSGQDYENNLQDNMTRPLIEFNGATSDFVAFIGFYPFIKERNYHTERQLLSKEKK